MRIMSGFEISESIISVYEYEIYNYFSDLVGLTVGEIKEDDIKVGRMKTAYVPLIGSAYIDGMEVHLDWNAKEEYSTGELANNISASSLNEEISGQKITSIVTNSTNQDGEAYVYAGTENGQLLQIPLGFNPETLEFHGHLEVIIPEIKRKWITNNYIALRNK